MATEQATSCPSRIEALYQAFDAHRLPPSLPDELEEAATQKFCEEQDQFVAAIVGLRAQSGRDILIKLDLLEREDYLYALEAALRDSIREDVRALMPETGRA